MKKIAALVLSGLMLIGAASVVSAAEEYAYKVASPNGAPGLALASLAVDNPEAYTYLAADTITAEFANAESDFVIAPLNAGAKLYQAGKSTYKLGAVVTWGNLYFASQRENFALEDINGAEITLFAENTINSSIALYVLEQNGITPSAVSYLSGAADTQALLLSDAEAIVLTAEPALTAASMKNDKITSISLNELYEKATGYDGYTQAGLFIRQQTIDEHPEAVESFLALAEESCGKCESDVEAVAQAAVSLEILPNEAVAMKAIPGCNIRFMKAADAKEQVELTANVDLSQFGGAVPADDFYYGAE